MTDRPCDCCGKIMNYYEGNVYDISIVGYSLFPESAHFDVCNECKNKIISMVKGGEKNAYEDT